MAYGGTDRADPVVEVADAKGRLEEQVDRALGWLMGQMRREVYDGADRPATTPWCPWRRRARWW